MGMTEVDLLLHRIAHARAGDKGDRLDISLIAYRPEAWPVLLEQVTEARVLELFRRNGATGVKRYELPGLKALNFVIDDVLEGGVNSSLGLDTHGKTYSFRLLGLSVRVPDDLVTRIVAGPQADQ
jgi:hypothetical protein